MAISKTVRSTFAPDCFSLSLVVILVILVVLAILVTVLLIVLVLILIAILVLVLLILILVVHLFYLRSVIAVIRSSSLPINLAFILRFK